MNVIVMMMTITMMTMASKHDDSGVFILFVHPSSMYPRTGKREKDRGSLVNFSLMCCSIIGRTKN